MSVMGEETQTFQRFDKRGRERYMLIHKKPVGPKTAEGLFSLYGELSQIQKRREMHVAGWAALEASIVGTQYSPDTRLELVNAAEDCWEYALQLEQEFAAERAWLSSRWPNTENEYRIASALATIPIFKELPFGKPAHETVKKVHSDLVSIASMNAHDMVISQQHGLSGRASNHKGFAFEILSRLPITRLGTGRLIPCPSFPRSDSGSYYPEQTHDIQFLLLNGSRITSVVPTEVKSTLSLKHFRRYTGSALISGDMLTCDGQLTIPKIVGCYQREIDGVATESDRAALDLVTSAVIHSIQHYRRPERAGAHCYTKTCTYHAEPAA